MQASILGITLKVFCFVHLASKQVSDLTVYMRSPVLYIIDAGSYSIGIIQLQFLTNPPILACLDVWYAVAPHLPTWLQYLISWIITLYSENPRLPWYSSKNDIQVGEVSGKPDKYRCFVGTATSVVMLTYVKIHIYK